MSFFRRRMMIESGYNITFNLDGLTAIAPSNVKPLLSCNISFIEDSGKLLLPSTVVVRMGGVDITEDVFNVENNTILIPYVIGNVQVNAKAQYIDSAILSDYDLLYCITPITLGTKPGFDLGYKATNNTKYHTEFKNTGGSITYILGEVAKTYTSGCCYICHRVNTSYFLWNSISNTFTPRLDNMVNHRTYITMDKGLLTYTWEGLTGTYTKDARQDPVVEFTSDANATIFGNYNSIADGGARGQVFLYEHYEDDVLINKFLPARRKSDGAYGLLDILTNAFKVPYGNNVWITQYIAPTFNLNNCTTSILSGESSGDKTHAVIGETWSIKITPTVNYTFRDNLSVLQIIVNGSDISNNAVYDNLTDSWEITLNPHWKDTISITATAESYMLYTDIDGLELTNSQQPVLNSSWSSGFSNTNGKQLYPDSIIVKMGGVDITSTAFDIATNQVKIDNVTGAIDITAKSVEVNSDYEPMLYISTRSKDHGNAISFPYYPTSNTKLELDVDLILLTYAILFAMKNPNTAPSATAPQFAFWVRITSSSNYSLSWGSTTTNTTSTAAGRLRTGARTLVTCDRGKFTYTNLSNGTRTLTLNGGVWTNTSNKLKIMAYTNTTSTTQGGYASNGKVYRATISDYNESNNDYDLTLDYIPVKRVSDDEVGLYDLVNGDFIENPGNYILPYVNPTLNLTNCTGTLLSNKDTGITNHIVYEKEWSCKYTPSSGTFESFLVLVNDEDVTNDVATYDSTTDSWTVTLTAHWGDTIDITANAQ